jgi:hypothetical protein
MQNERETKEVWHGKRPRGDPLNIRNEHSENTQRKARRMKIIPLTSM